MASTMIKARADPNRGRWLQRRWVVEFDRNGIGGLRKVKVGKTKRKKEI
ncbi:hypothetical protein RchiOBHm_Chr4g0447271 [Rosa chinensis]|uniref:Uncharacterized protein n=1 Tax=Rosa chinensis TaxID=74649 RepID=A0A2P6R4W7_ROSCH|nr:hypothetical protein RchiOBHm_Chr4g0447271 [Rosa chinensis]